MKHILLILLTAGSLMLQAAEQKVTCLIMDADSSLIYGAKVTNSRNKDTLRTGCDGRIVIDIPARLKLKVEADGYEKATFRLTTSDRGKTLVLLLKAAPRREYSNGGLLYSKRSGPSDAVYLTMETSAMRTAAAPMALGAKAAMEEESDAVLYADEPVANTMPSAGKLTAGEVNDFAKWNLWTEIINGELREHVQEWGISTRERYTVQVINKQNFPLVGVPVELRTEGGQILFSAVTDNTGKAELYKPSTDTTGKEKMVLVCGEETEPTQNNNLITTFVLDRPCHVPETADVFFVFDATGSMGDELRYLQAEMKDVIARSQSAVEGLSIRTGALVYRDFGDDYLTRIARLSSDINKTQTFIDRQEANGGGDFPEAVPEALLASLRVAGWNPEARARIAFLILDAPCHRDSATLSRLHEAVNEAALMGVRVVPVVCSGVDKSGEMLMRSIALATNGTSFFLTDDSGIGHTHIKPTTDTLVVEHLNDMLVRTIIEFTRMPACEEQTAWQQEAQQEDPIEQFLPNPTDDPNRPDAPQWAVEDVMTVRPNPCEDVCYADIRRPVAYLSLCDMSGKTIYTFETGSEAPYTVMLPMQGLATGVYFLKAYAEGRWYTAKIIRK